MGLKVFWNKARPHPADKTPKSISDYDMMYSALKMDVPELRLNEEFDFFEITWLTQDTINSESVAQAPMV